MDAGALVWWLDNVECSSAIPNPDLDGVEKETHTVLSSADQIGLIVHTLGFSKRQLAELFGVSRQAIYDWLKGGNVNDKNAQTLSRLAGLLAKVTGDPRRSLYHRFTTQPLAEGVTQHT